MAQHGQPVNRIYTPLKPYQTRLVKLLAGSFDEPVRCELHVANMLFDEGMGVASEPDAVTYKALSYSWGHPETTAPIECNGQQLLIPPAMLDALQYLRLEDQDTWWWCDALSISQTDPVEKSQQVKQMLLIFVKAEEVVAWLGLPDRDYADNAEMIDSLSERDFWHRAWIVQEMYAARKVTFRCGAHCLNVESFGARRDLDLLRYVSKTPVMDALRHPQVPRGRQGRSYHDVVPKLNGFWGTVERNSRRGASNPRDLVYSVIGMINNEFDNDFLDYEVDYTKSVVDCSVYLTIYLMRLDKSPVVCWYNRKTKSNPELPSWVLDLNDLRVMGGIGPLFNGARRLRPQWGDYNDYFAVEEVVPYTLTIKGIRQGRLGQKRTPHEDCARCESGEWGNRTEFEDRSNRVAMLLTEVFHNSGMRQPAQNCLAPAYAQKDDILVADEWGPTLILRASQDLPNGTQQTYEFIGVAWFGDCDSHNTHPNKLPDDITQQWADLRTLAAARQHPERYVKAIERLEHTLRVRALSDSEVRTLARSDWRDILYNDSREFLKKARPRLSDRDWETILEKRKDGIRDLVNNKRLLKEVDPETSWDEHLEAKEWRRGEILSQEDAVQWFRLIDYQQTLDACADVEIEFESFHIV